MVEVACDNCGEATEKKPSKIERNEHLFCSQDCYHDFGRPDMEGENNPNPSKEKVTVDCEHCGEQFEVHEYRSDSARFCSRSCRNSFMAGQSGEETPAWKGAKESYECDNCGDSFSEYPYKTHRFCSDSCYREAAQEMFAGENNPAWRGGRVDNYGPNWKQQRQQVLERDGYTCQECGKHADDMPRSPDVHHKKRLGWFKEEYDAPEWYEKGNRLDNLVTLCPSCHMAKEWKDGGLS